MYNLFLRSLEEPGNADEEKDAGLGHTDHMILQVSQHLSQPRHLGWLRVTGDIGGPFIHTLVIQ